MTDETKPLLCERHGVQDQRPDGWPECPFCKQEKRLPSDDCQFHTRGIGPCRCEIDRLRAENAAEVKARLDVERVASDYEAELHRLRAENARQAETIARLREVLTAVRESHRKSGGTFKVDAQIDAVLAGEPVRTRLHTAAQALIDFWDTLTEEQVKLSTVEADELTALESELREALKEGR